jgi:hypothetical protein
MGFGITLIASLFFRVKSKGIREWGYGIWDHPKCFFFFRVKSKGIREWEMGYRISQLLLFL